MSSFWSKIKVKFFRSVAEQRKYPRVSLSVRVTNLTSGNFGYFLASNISAGGIFLKAEEPLHKGTPLSLQFSLPDLDHQIKVEAEVVRVQISEPNSPHSSGMGLRFTNIPKDDRQAIEEFVKEKL